MIRRLALAASAAVIGWSAPEAFSAPSAVDAQTCTCPAPVAIVADSIISRTRTNYPATWAIYAEGGRSSDAAGVPGGYTGREAVGIALDRLDPDGTLIIELGANDVIGDTTAAEFRAFVDWTIAAAGPGRNVVWVTPFVASSLSRSIDLRGAVLAAIPTATASRVVVDWFALARYLPVGVDRRGAPHRRGRPGARRADRRRRRAGDAVTRRLVAAVEQATPAWARRRWGIPYSEPDPCPATGIPRPDYLPPELPEPQGDAP